MPKEQRLRDNPIETIPEVRDFEDVKYRYRFFREQNPKFFEILDALTEEYNQKAEAAEKVVRARNISCGDFHCFQENTKHNVEKLVDAIGVEAFEKLGGTVTQVRTTKYSIDKKQIEAGIARKDIDEKTVEAVKTTEAKYHMPSKIILP